MTAAQQIIARLASEDVPSRKASLSPSHPPLSSTTRTPISTPSIEENSLPQHGGHNAVLSQSPSAHQQRAQAPPPSSFGSRMYGRRDLTIAVPPRNRSSILVMSSPPSSPSTVGMRAYPLTSPSMTSDSSESQYSSSSLLSVSDPTTTGFSMTPSSDESFSTSTPLSRRPPASKPPMIRFPTYHRGMAVSPATQQHSAVSPEAGHPEVPQKQARLSKPPPSTGPLTPRTPSGGAFTFGASPSSKTIGDLPLKHRPPKVSPPLPLTNVHAL